MTLICHINESERYVGETKVETERNMDKEREANKKHGLRKGGKQERIDNEREAKKINIKT